MASRALALLVFGIGGPLVGGIFALSAVAASAGGAAFAGLVLLFSQFLPL